MEAWIRLIVRIFQERPTELKAWIERLLDLEMILAFSDHKLTALEQQALSSSTQALGSLYSLRQRGGVLSIIASWWSGLFSKEERLDIGALQARSEALLQACKEEYEPQKERVFQELRATLSSLEEPERDKTNRELMEGALSFLYADNHGPETEEAKKTDLAFFFQVFTPEALGLSEAHAKAAMSLDAQNFKLRTILGLHGFEIYLMLVDTLPRREYVPAPPKAPNPMIPKKLQGMMAMTEKMEDFCAKHHLGLQMIMSYFFGVVGYPFPTTTEEKFQKHSQWFLERATSYRMLREAQGIDARLKTMIDDLRLEVTDEKHIPEALSQIATVVQFAIKMSSPLQKEAQQALFREKIAPALKLPTDDLLTWIQKK